MPCLPHWTLGEHEKMYGWQPESNLKTANAYNICNTSPHDCLFPFDKYEFDLACRLTIPSKFQHLPPLTPMLHNLSTWYQAAGDPTSSTHTGHGSTYFMVRASSMKSSSDIVPSLVILMATSMVPRHFPCFTVCHTITQTPVCINQATTPVPCWACLIYTSLKSIMTQLRKIWASLKGLAGNETF